MSDDFRLQEESIRQRNLTDSVIQLKQALEDVYERNYHEAGVIDRGYYTSFNNVLNQWKGVGIFDRFMVSEEEIVDGGNLIKIPVIDLFKNGDNKRIFIISKILKSKYGIN